MCGRYRLSRRKQIVEKYFETASDEPEWNPRYNIAPTQPVPVIRQNPKEPMMINARSETAATKPAFRDPLANRRCLILRTGFTSGCDMKLQIRLSGKRLTRPAVPSAVLYEAGRFCEELSKSSRTMNPTIHGYRNREGPVFLPASRRIGARVGGTVSKSNLHKHRQE